MHEAKLTEGVILKKIVESIKDLVTDVNLDVSPTGISLQAMDSSHVALVSLQLSMEGFEKFRCDKTQTLGINIANLAKVMKLGDNDDTITLKAEEDPSHLTIIFENEKKGRLTEFNINLIQIDSEHLSITDSEGGSTISMGSSEFSKICRELHALSETVVIETQNDFVKFSVEGDSGSGSIKLEQNEGESRDTAVSLKCEDQVNLSFALRYLTMFNKASTLSNVVDIKLSNEAPLTVQYKIEEFGTLKFYLAPKITDDEE